VCCAILILVVCFDTVATSSRLGGAKYCDGHVCLSVCLCLSVCPLACLKNHMSKLHEIFCSGFPGPWLGRPLTTVEYVTYFGFCGWCHVFSQWSIWHLVLAVSMWWPFVSPSSHKFRTYSPGGATLFEFFVVHNGSKLHTGVISDDDVLVAASG